MAWLDLHAPGWERKVNLDELDLGDCQGCVLGQLTGDYRHVNPPSFDKDWATFRNGPALKLPGLDGDQCRALGFEKLKDAPASIPGYHGLTLAWKRAITARLANPPVKRGGRVTELRLPRFACDPIREGVLR
jgi:hypothetical protein